MCIRKPKRKGDTSLANNLGASKQAGRGLLRLDGRSVLCSVGRPAEMEICSEIYVKESILGGMRRERGEGGEGERG